MLQTVLPKATEIAKVAGRLTHSSDYALEFSLRIRVRNGKHPLSYRLIVARNDRERAETVNAEIRNFKWLATRLPKNAMPVLSAGKIFQPDRHGRSDSNREMPAYLTRALPPVDRCAVGNAQQLATGGSTVRLLTQADTDVIRTRLLELCLRAYDPAARRALPPPDVERGALRVKSAGRGNIELWITGCPTLWDRIDPVTLFHRLAGFEWQRGNFALPLLPTSPDQILVATTAALGKKNGRELLAHYTAALESGRYPEHRRLTRQTLRMLLGDTAP